MIKNIVLDIGGVLADFRWKELMVDLGLSKEAIEHLKKEMIMSPLWNEFDRGVLGQDTVVAMFKENNPAFENEIDLFFQNIEHLVKQFDYTNAFIMELKEKGYKVYILSNYPTYAFSVHEKTRFSFLPYIDGKVVSGFVKMIKPDSDIYEYLLHTYDLLPEECVFLDDVPKNIHTACELGMKGIVFTSYTQAREELGKLITLTK